MKHTTTTLADQAAVADAPPLSSADASADTFVKSTVRGVVFADGTQMSGTWVTEYDSSGKIVGITDSAFTVTGAGGTTNFTGAYVLPYANPSSAGSFEMTFPAASGGSYDSLYVDWVGEQPTTLDAGSASLYTSVRDGSGDPIRLENTGVIHDAPQCFLAGTMIGRPGGATAIEDVAAGDMVSLATGGEAPVLWVGTRAIAKRFGDPLTVLPIRIRAGALGDSLPIRDLHVSPCHALLVDGVLVQANALVNDVTIVRERDVAETFTYYHLELADHALVLAEGVPAETFIDNVDRMGFDNWADRPDSLGTAPLAEMAYPRAKASRQVPAAIRGRLLGLAQDQLAKVA